jgi:hypothetical protein
MMNRAVNNAIVNSMRKKHQREVPLFKRNPKVTDADMAKENVKKILEIERKNGKGWVEKILGSNRQVRKNGK